MSRNDCQGGDMARLDIRKVPSVHGRHGSDRQALAESYHRGIGAAHVPVRVAAHQCGHASDIGVEKLSELEPVARTDPYAVEELGFGLRAEILVDHVTRFGEHRRRDDQRLIAIGKPVPALSMMSIAPVGQGNQDIGVNDDHEHRRLPAEPLRQQLIDSFR